VNDRFSVIFAGGGTGGHLYPAIAIAQALGDRADVAFIGTAGRLETKIVPQAGYALETVRSSPLSRKLSFAFVAMAPVNALGIFQAMRALLRRKPEIVIATGGYVCFPVVIAARILRATGRTRAPIVLFEPNARPGLANRTLAPLVDEIWGGYGAADARFSGKYVRTGVPVRASLRALPLREEAIQRLGLDPARRTLLAMGGSQGARSINNAIAALVRNGGVPQGLQVIHVTALRQPEQDKIESPHYVAYEYLDDMADAYAAADLVLARAGASTLAELTATGRPALLVPYPHAADDHQSANAAALVETGAAVLLDDRSLAEGRLPAILADVTQPARLAALRSAAEQRRGVDPLTIILPRVETMRMRKKRA
jgi:UDP-N-acetylglucosamine--N-acetylmuramyl-(pentapeptide) pyrophosphoryl-undecaprenol N-acetylglucosamine transferase